MSTDTTWQIDCSSLEESLAFAGKLGSQLKGGEMIELISDVGGGKTTFVKGLVAGMGSSEHVSSPSFTISNQYKSDDKTVYHFDFYRLTDAGLMQQELLDALADHTGVVVVEWADVVAGVLPEDRLRIQITVTDEQSRRYVLSAPDKLTYLKS